MSLLFNMLSMLVIVFLPRSKCLLISWVQSPSAVILEPKKIKSLTVSIVSPSICHEVMGPDAMILVFECWIFFSMLNFKPAFYSLLSLQFLCTFCHNGGVTYWCLFQQSWFQLVLHPAWYFAWCTLKLKKISRVTIYSLDILLCTPFSIWNHSIVPCFILTVASWPAYSFLRKQVR